MDATPICALVSHTGDRVCQILVALEQFGLQENIVVIFTSGYGENLNEHGLVGKSQPYDSSACVSLIVSYPTTSVIGQRYSEIIETVDIVRTILDWCGIQITPQIQKWSFSPLIEGRDYQERKFVFIELRIPFAHSYKVSCTKHTSIAKVILVRNSSSIRQ